MYVSVKEALARPDGVKVNMEGLVGYVNDPTSFDKTFTDDCTGERKVLKQFRQSILITGEGEKIWATAFLGRSNLANFTIKDKGKKVYLKDAKIGSYKGEKQLTIGEASFTPFGDKDEISQLPPKEQLDIVQEPTPTPPKPKEETWREEIEKRSEAVEMIFDKAVAIYGAVKQARKSVFEGMNNLDEASIINTLTIHLGKNYTYIKEEK